MICNVRIPTQAISTQGKRSKFTEWNLCNLIWLSARKQITLLEMLDYFSSSAPSGAFVWTHLVCVMGGVQHQESAISQSINHY